MRDDWIEITFGEAALYLNGRGFKKTEWESSGLPIIRIQNLNDKNAVFNYTNGDFQDKYSVENGDLLFAWAASLGVYIWNRGDAWLNQHIFKVVPQSFLLKPYLFYSLQKTIQYFYSKAHGSGMVHITKKKFEETTLLFPPLPEQRAIVAKIEQLFSELDNGIANLKTAQDKLEIYRQAVLKKAFEGELTNTWREQQTDLPSAVELLEQIKVERQRHYEQQLADWEKAVESWVGNGKEGKKPTKPKVIKVPEEIDSKELDYFPKIASGYSRLGLFIKNIEAGKSFRCEERPPLESEVGVTKVSSVSWKEYNETESKTCTNESRINPDYFIKSGDFLFSRANTIELVGACVMVKSTNLQVMLSDKILRIKYSFGKDEFFLYYLRSILGRKEIETRSTGNQDSMRNIGQDRIRNIIIPVFSLEEQTQIVQEIESRLSVCDKLSDTIKEQLAKAEALRQSILKKAFEGRLLNDDEIEACKQEADWEPAEQLLARIKAEKVEA